MMQTFVTVLANQFGNNPQIELTGSVTSRDKEGLDINCKLTTASPNSQWLHVFSDIETLEAHALCQEKNSNAHSHSPQFSGVPHLYTTLPAIGPRTSRSYAESY